MSAIENLKISQKVTYSFGLLLSLMIALGGLSIYEIREIKGKVSEITNDRMPAIAALDDIKYAMARHRTLLARYAMADDAVQIAEVETGLIEGERTLNGAFERFRPFISASVEREGFAKVQSEWSALQQAYVPLKDAAKRGDSAVAETTFRNSVSHYNSTSAAVEVLVRYNEGATKRSVTQAEETVAFAQVVVLLIGSIALLIGIAAAFAMIRTVAKPIVSMTDAMRRLAEKDMAVAIPARGRKDEVGAMAEAVQVFKDNMIKNDEMERAAAAERRAREARAVKIEQLTKSFDDAARRVVEGLAASSAALQKNSSAMSATAEETSRQSTAVAAAAEQASTNVQTVASAAEELSSSIREIARQVAESASISQQAVAEAERTSAIVQELVAAAGKIGSVTNLIQQIAGQTNLLALNATIEAARAGDAGKGFAVVASEVKGLANQTARATDEIAAQISAIQTASGQSVDAIASISGTIKKMNEIAATIAAAVEEQGAATAEIARNVQQASAGTTEVSSNISGVTQAATDTGKLANDVKTSADGVASQADDLKQEVDSFLTSVRAA